LMTIPPPRNFEHTVEVQSDYRRCQEIRDEIVARTIPAAW